MWSIKWHVDVYVSVHDAGVEEMNRLSHWICSTQINNNEHRSRVVDVTLVCNHVLRGSMLIQQTQTLWLGMGGRGRVKWLLARDAMGLQLVVCFNEMIMEWLTCYSYQCKLFVSLMIIDYKSPTLSIRRCQGVHWLYDWSWPKKVLFSLDIESPPRRRTLEELVRIFPSVSQKRSVLEHCSDSERSHRTAPQWMWCQRSWHQGRAGNACPACNSSVKVDTTNTE